MKQIETQDLSLTYHDPSNGINEAIRSCDV